MTMIEFPQLDEELIKKLEEEDREMDRRAAKEAEYIMAYINNEPEDNPIIRKYRENLYNDLWDMLSNWEDWNGIGMSYCFGRNMSV